VPRHLTYQGLVVASAVIFLALPFVTAFNELLTMVVTKIQLYILIQDFVVPIEVRMVGAVLRYLFGIETTVTSSLLHLQAAERALSVGIGWNCIGWQSLILYCFTIFTGLRGPFTRTSKALCTLIGLQGTILLNITRIVLVVLVTLFWGSLPALIFHDYAGTFILVIWLVAFWDLSYRYILRPIAGASD